eukprot:jgi/Galph1/5207/GphlegSOOS_G3853.1
MKLLSSGAWKRTCQTLIHSQLEGRTFLIHKQGIVQSSFALFYFGRDFRTDKRQEALENSVRANPLTSVQNTNRENNTATKNIKNTTEDDKKHINWRHLFSADNWFQQRESIKENYPHYDLMLPLLCRTRDSQVTDEFLERLAQEPDKLNYEIQKVIYDSKRWNIIFDLLYSEACMPHVYVESMLQISQHLRDQEQFRECLVLWHRWLELSFQWDHLTVDEYREILHEWISCYSAMGMKQQVECLADVVQSEGIASGNTSACLFDVYTNQTHSHQVNVIKAMHLLLSSPVEKQTADETWLRLAKAMVIENVLEHGKWAVLFIDHLEKSLQLDFFNFYLFKLAHLHRHDLCLEVLQEMKRRDLQPTEETIAAIMRAYINNGQYHVACDVFETLQKENNLQYEANAMSELLIAVSRDGSLSSVLGVLDSLLQLGHVANDVAIRSVLLEISYMSSVEESLAALEFIAQRSIPISFKTLDILLLIAKNSGEWKYAKVVFWLYLKYGHLPNFYSFELLMRTLTRQARGERMINRMQKEHLLLSSDSSEATQILSDISQMYHWMISCGIFPTRWIVREMVRAAASGGHAPVAQQVMLFAKNKLKVELTEDTYEFLINAFAKVNNVAGVSHGVRLMTEQLGKPSLRALNIWMRSCLRVKDVAHCLQVFDELVQYGYQPNEHTFACLIIAAGMEKNLQRGRHLIRRMIEQGLTPDSSVYIALLKAMENCSNQIPKEFLHWLYNGIEMGHWVPNGYFLAKWVRMGYRQLNWSDHQRIYRWLEQNRSHIASSQLLLPFYEFVSGALSFGQCQLAIEWIEKFVHELNVSPMSALRYIGIYQWSRVGLLESARETVVSETMNIWKHSRNREVEQIWQQVQKDMLLEQGRHDSGEEATSKDQVDLSRVHSLFQQRLRQALQSRYNELWRLVENGHVDNFWKQLSQMPPSHTNITPLNAQECQIQKWWSIDERVFEESPVFVYPEGSNLQTIQTELEYTNNENFVDFSMPLIVISDATKSYEPSFLSRNKFLSRTDDKSLHHIEVPGEGSVAAWTVFIESSLLGPSWARPLQGDVSVDDFTLRRYEKVYNVYSLDALYALEYLESRQLHISESLVKQLYDRISYLQKWKSNEIWKSALEAFKNREKQHVIFRFSSLYHR